MGSVYEPYLSGTPDIGVFTARWLLSNFTFGEAAYAAQQALSWQTTVVGDPLYRPFRFRHEQRTKASNEWDAYRAGVEAWAKPGGSDKALEAAAKRTKSGAVYEGLGLLHLRAGNNADARRAFQQARSAYSSAEDRIRVAVHETGAIKALSGNDPALAFVRQQIAANESNPATNILRILEAAFRAPKAQGPAAVPKPAKR